jgi:hypothetical protein
MAKSSSVVVGSSEATRRAGASRRRVSPASSTATMRTRVPPAGRQASAIPRRSALKWLAHPRGSEDGRARADAGPESPPFPPPRACVVARAGRSPGFGLSLAFPVAQWRMERGTYARYSGGAAPELHRLPSVTARVFRLVSGDILGSERASRKSATVRPHRMVVTWHTAGQRSAPHSADPKPSPWQGPDIEAQGDRS